jgi:hypothetical protein
MIVAEGTICMTHQLTTDILNAALESLTSKRQQIDQQIDEVRRLLAGSRNGASAGPASARHKRRISAAGRRAIAAAQRRRWAEKKAAGLTPTPETKSPKRKLSPAGRAAIVAALKKRWAAKRAERSRSGKAAAKEARTKAA